MTSLLRKVLLLSLLSLPALAAQTGTTTKQAKTAAPVSVSPTSTTNSEGNSDAFARANHVHKFEGPVPINKGGTGVLTLPCATGQAVASNGTVFSCVDQPGYGNVGATAPTSAAFVAGVNSSGNAVGMLTCDKSAAISATASGATLVIDNSASGKKIYICGFYMATDGPSTLSFVEGTGSTCAGGVVAVTGGVPAPTGGGFSFGLSPFAIPFTATNSNNLCINLSLTANVGGWISYAVQ